MEVSGTHINEWNELTVSKIASIVSTFQWVAFTEDLFCSEGIISHLITVQKGTLPSNLLLSREKNKSQDAKKGNNI